MPIPVRFTFLTGLRRRLFSNARLVGSWDQAGRYADSWASAPMREETAEDGCPCFVVDVEFDAAQVGWTYRWGVRFDGPSGRDVWAIATEVDRRDARERHREFTLQPVGERPQEERYYLTSCRRLGAQKRYRAGAAGIDQSAGIEFAVWAPNARAVEVVFGIFGPDPEEQTGYIADDGTGIDPTVGPISLTRTSRGVWRTRASEPALADFTKFDHRSYMFRITCDDGVVRYRTDLYSRCQIGKGRDDPNGQPYAGHFTVLDGTKSCSVVIDPETVTEHFEEKLWPEIRFIPEQQFWASEFDAACKPPRSIDDLVIYELHVGGLGFGHAGAGTFEDAMRFIPYLRDLGVNAVQLMPVSEFEGTAQWGYGTLHYHALEFSAGGRDQLKHLVRECHRNGLAVLLDVVYNHYHHNAERAQWAYDTSRHELNPYYWYEGVPSRYSFLDGGYVDNESTGYAPRYHDEFVRHMFISSAVALIEEFHVDGLRVDQVTAIHAYNRLHADGRPVPDANIFGAKMLRELCRTLRMVRPDVILIAEDHSGWGAVTEPLDEGGLGFDASWYADYYHHLIGDAQADSQWARLVVMAGLGDDRALAIGRFASALTHAKHSKVVYQESHDEAGNSSYVLDGRRVWSQRTIAAAVNGAPLVGDTRRYAEARVRVAAGLTLLSPAAPMFFMGEEVGAQKPYRYGDFLASREDMVEERTGNGRQLYRFYRDVIRLRRERVGFRSHAIDVIHADDGNRVLAIRRWSDGEEFLVVASLNNQAFTSGYVLRTDEDRLRDGVWREIFNSDAAIYGGNDVGNGGAVRSAHGGTIDVVVPANGFVVFERS